MKKIIALALSVLMVQAFTISSFADLAPGQVVRSNDTQVSEGKVVFSRPAFYNSIPWNFTKNTEITPVAENEDEESSDTIELKTATSTFKYEFHTVTKTDLKTKKTSTLHAGVDVYDIYISGNSVFVEMINYDIYRYDKNGKLTASFKATGQDTYYVSAGRTILFREGNSGVAVSMALENQTKLTAIKTFDDPYLNEYEGRTFLVDDITLYEISTGKLVKLGMMDNFTATKTDAFLVTGGSIVKVSNGKSTKILTTTSDITKVRALGQSLYILDESGTLKSSDLSGKGLKVVKNYVSQLNKINNEITGYVRSENGGLFQFVEKDKEPKLTTIDANLFVVDGKRIVYIDSFGKLRYKENYQSEDLWSADLRLYSAKDVLKEKDNARFGQLFLSATQIYALTEISNGYNLHVFDLKGNLVSQKTNVTKAWVTDGKLLNVIDATGRFEIDLSTGVTKTLVTKAADGSWSYTAGNFEITVGKSRNAGYDLVNVVDKTTQKNVFTDNEVQNLYLLDANNLFVLSDNLGSVAFNATSGKVTTLESQIYEDGSPIFWIIDGTSKQLVYYNQEDYKMNNYDLKTGTISFVKQFDEEDSLFYSNNELLTFVDGDGIVWFYDSLTGESIETPIDMEEFNLPTFDRSGNKVYIYDDVILYGYFDLVTEELVYFQAQ